MRIYILLLLVFYSQVIGAQSGANYKTTIPFRNVSNVSADLNNSFYVTDDKGNLFQFDSTGKEINRFSALQSASVTVLESSRTMNVFMFYRDLQKYVFLNRFLALSDLVSLDPSVVGFAYLAAPSLDNNLWVFDNTSFTLKKIDLKLQKAIIERPLDLLLDPNDYSINYIKEYQNRLYINNGNKGILSFDNFGNYSTTIPIKTDYFNFSGEDLYYIKNDTIAFYNIYTGKEDKIKTDCSDCRFVLSLRNSLVLFRENEIRIQEKNKKD
jgi:hypothetical protein